MERRVLWSCLLCLAAVAVGWTSASFIPSEAVDGQLTDPCPVGCSCNQDDRGATCYVAYSPSLLDQLSLWHVTHLVIHGIDSVAEAVSKENVQVAVLGDWTLPSLPTLRHLRITEVPLETIGAQTFKGTPRLQSLSIVNSSVARVQDGAFQGLLNLHTLILSNNKVTSLPSSSFHELARLRKLDLSWNHLTSLSDSTFRNLTNLEHLDLSWNLLDQLPANLFSPTMNLKVLNLAGNDLMYVDDFIHNMTTVQHLDLSSNNIQFVGEHCVQALMGIEKVEFSRNPFRCTCLLHKLIEMVQSNTTRFRHEQFTCYGPDDLIGAEFKTLDVSALPCEPPTITNISQPYTALYQSNVHLRCQVSGASPIGLYWVTPWGEKFAHSDFSRRLPYHFTDTKQHSYYKGPNFVAMSSVFVTADGALHIEKFRGYFAGEFQCVSTSLLGSSNSSVTIQVGHNLKTYYHDSLYIAGMAAGSMFVLAIIIGLVRFLVNKCCHGDDCNCCCCSSDDDISVGSDGKEDEKFQEVEVSIEISDYDIEDYSESDFYDKYSTLQVPVNSPLSCTPRASPMKCPTPSAESDPDPEKPISLHIWETLDEARTRLKSGAGRKIERVRYHVKSITSTGTVKIRHIKETGSLRIQSIKESGSNAASLVRNSVVQGMEQVKYGVQSIKEFCGTGDMGTGTVSVISISTDVDTKEQVQIVKSHTFV